MRFLDVLRHLPEGPPGQITVVLAPVAGRGIGGRGHRAVGAAHRQPALSVRANRVVEVKVHVRNLEDFVRGRSGRWESRSLYLGLISWWKVHCPGVDFFPSATSFAQEDRTDL